MEYAVPPVFIVDRMTANLRFHEISVLASHPEINYIASSQSSQQIRSNDQTTSVFFICRVSELRSDVVKELPVSSADILSSSNPYYDIRVCKTFKDGLLCFLLSSISCVI